MQINSSSGSAYCFMGFVVSVCVHDSRLHGELLDSNLFLLCSEEQLLVISTLSTSDTSDVREVPVLNKIF